MDIIRRFFVFFRMLWQVYRGLPIWGFVWITRHCHQGCSHCYVWDNKTPNMTWEVWENTISQFKKLGIPYVSIFGGEPNEHPELLRMIAYANQQGLVVYLNTDITAYPVGRLLDVVRVLLHNPSNVLSFSLDTTTSVSGNKRSNDVVKERLKVLASTNVKVKLHCNLTFTEDTIGQWQDLIDLLQNFPMPIGVSVRGAYYPFTDTPRNVHLLSAVSHTVVKSICAELEKRKRAATPVINTFGFLRLFPKFVENHVEWDCGTQRDIISVDCDGRIMHCSYQPVGGLPSQYQFPCTHMSGELTVSKLAELRQASEHILQDCNSKCLSPAYCCTSDYRSWREWWYLARSFFLI